MKTSLITILIFTLSNCTSQNKVIVNASNTIEDTLPVVISQKIQDYHLLKNTAMDHLNVVKFNKNKNHLDSYKYTLPDGSKVEESGDASAYYSEITAPNSLFTSYREFYANGNIKLRGINGPNQLGEYGTWYEYDKLGQIIKQTDYDKPFIYTWADIEKFCKENDIDLHQETTIFNRTNDSVPNGLYWEINYTGKYKEQKGRFIIRKDGKNGELLLVKILAGATSLPDGTGKIILYDTIFVKK